MCRGGGVEPSPSDRESRSGRISGFTDPDHGCGNGTGLVGGGAQIISCDDLGAGLSPPLCEAVKEAARRVEAILSARVGTVALVDEMLQILFWLRGEGLATDASAQDLERWLSMNSESIESNKIP